MGIQNSELSRNVSRPERTIVFSIISLFTNESVCASNDHYT